MPLFSQHSFILSLELKYWILFVQKMLAVKQLNYVFVFFPICAVGSCCNKNSLAGDWTVHPYAIKEERSFGGKVGGGLVG